MAAPCALFTSCSNYKAQNIIKDILNTESLNEGNCLLENISSFDWHVETKYYSADVKLCVTEERTIGDQEFAESVQAIVIYFDPSQESSFSLVKSWLPYIDQIEPEVKMLVCDRCTENTMVTRLDAQKWCIENGFELVELNADVDSDSETEDDFHETTGIKRIIQALQAHTWPNLEMKENSPAYSPYIRQLMQEEYDSKKAFSAADDTESEICDGHSSVSDNSETSKSGENIKNDSNDSITSSENVAIVDGASSGDGASGKKEDKKKKEKQPTKEERLDSLLPDEDMALFEALGAEDPGGESFEKLFERFGSMKEKASNLPPGERKKYAEKVAIAFWRAMGGDEDEIDNLSDSDDPEK